MGVSVQEHEEIIIGICGGVGPAAGLLLHQNILNHTENKGTDQGHLDVVHISRSRDTVDRTTFLLGNDVSSNPAEGMSRTLDMLRETVILRQASAVVGVPCNTFHAEPIWQEFTRLAQLNQHSKYKIQLVHMLDETIEMIGHLAPTCTRVGLLSTTGTRKSRVYHNLLEAKSYTVLQVNENMQEELHETIYHPEWGIKATAPRVSAKAIANFKNYATILSKLGAQVIILGCTEIPFAFHGVEQVGNAILIDPMVALARGLIKGAAKEKLKRMTAKRARPGFNSIRKSRAKPVRAIRTKTPAAVSLATTGGVMGFYNDFVDKMLATGI